MDKIDMLYLYGPDRNTPFEDTLHEVNKLDQEGLFSRFSDRNYRSWKVSAM